MKNLIEFTNFYKGFSVSAGKGGAGFFSFGKNLDLLGNLDGIRPQLSQNYNDDHTNLLEEGSNIRDFALIGTSLVAYGQRNTSDNDITLWVVPSSGGNWTNYNSDTTTTVPTDGRILSAGANIILWGGTTGNKLRYADTNGLGTITDLTGTMTTATNRGPMLLGSDGYGYFSWGTATQWYVASCVDPTADPPTVVPTSLTLPPGFSVISLMEWDNKCGILAKNSTSTESRLYIWDFEAALEFDIAKILPSKNALFARCIGDRIYVFCDDNGKLKIYAWSGGEFSLVKSFSVTKSMTGRTTEVTSITCYDAAVDVKNGIIYFGASFITTAGYGLSGIFAFSTHQSEMPYTIWHDRQPLLSLTTSLCTIYAIKYLPSSNVMWIAYIDTGASESSPVVHVTITDSSTSFAQNAYFETNIIDFGNLIAEIPLIELTFDPLSSSALYAYSITTYVKKNNASSWTSLGAYSTPDTIYTKLPLTGKFSNIQFKVEFGLSSTPAGTDTTSPPTLTGIYGYGELQKGRQN